MSVDTMGSEDLRNAMVDRLAADHTAKGLVLRPEVEAALRTVPRELYAPGVPAEEAYENTAIVTKRRGDESISSVSAPFLIAEMIGQAADALDGLEGRHVLEIGSGGYNASLLAELVGASGSVTTVDIDPEVTDRASACLAAAGYESVKVVCSDAEYPIEPGRRYDLIIVTVGAWDVPPAWRDQLTDDGVLVVPLRTFGMTRSWTLRPSGNGLVSESHRLCGFVPMQGDGAHEIRYVDIAEGVHLRLDEDEKVDAAAVEGILSRPVVEAWAGVSLPPRTVLADLDLWLATRLREGFVVLSAQQEAVDSGIVAPAWRFGTPANLSEGDGGITLTYRSALRWTDRMFDLGARAHGPDAEATVARMAGHMRAWVDAGSPAPTLHVLPADTPDGDLPDGAVLDKRRSRMSVTFTPQENHEKGVQ
ncbi:methyltransferase, FxLD system [Actinomadura rayongensis]|uniref:Protein-L-isoaspartate O-methyltransferase n=1 Tax=Actinomadura rayongensis TaxID=1429076 RepID=A0A6I4W8T5_9ACTN|nr:methyltransferase, FxLD system [Actinomadura rayongensis]MXQ65593.1 methyltransferase, FxLD system [Actinomadura rayongensis]